MSVSPVFRAELKRALASPGCPLCTISRDDDERYLRSLLHEGLSNAAMLERLSRAGGFCGEHAWALQRMEQSVWHDGLTNACFERPLLADALSSLDEPPLKRRGRRRAARHQHTASCPACAARSRMQQIKAAGMAEALADEALAHPFAARERGLCMPHFRLVWAEEMPDQVRQSLREVQHVQLRDLLDRLDRYLWKHHWNVTEPQLPEEEASWTEAVAMLSGDAVRERGDG